MGILDIILLCCFIPAIIQGVSKGFVKQVISLVSLILGAWAAFKFSSAVTTWLGGYFTSLDPKVLNIIAFAIIVILVVLLLNLVGELLTRVVKIGALGGLNKLLGIVFGIAKVALVLGLLIMVFEGINDKFTLVKPEVLDNAKVYSLLKQGAEFVFPYLKSFVTGGAAGAADAAAVINV